MDKCPADQRERAETIIREKLRDRGTGEAWYVSLHRFHGGWDVFVEGPDAGLRDALAAALAAAGFCR
jgi:hypothetical protein